MTANRAKIFLNMAAAFILGLSCLLPARSEAAVPSYLPYPSADSVILNPYGETDETTQLFLALLPYYRTESGRALRLEDRAGRGGATAWGLLSEREGDGYTLALINLQSLILRSMENRPAYRLDHIAPTNIMAEAPLALWVPEDSPFPSLDELIRSARVYPNQLIISGSGSNSQTHLASLRLNFLAGVKTIYLPYIGSSTAMEAAKMTQAHAAWGYALPDFGSQRRMRALAVAAPERLPSMPDVPTFEESNIGLFETAHFGLALPGSASSATRQAVAAYFSRVLSNALLQEQIAALGFSPSNLGIQEIHELLERERDRLSGLLTQFSME